MSEGGMTNSLVSLADALEAKPMTI